MKKNEALKNWTHELDRSPKAVEWLDSYLKGKPQATTIEDLEKGIKEGYITVREGLIWALVVGVQWNEKFEDTP